ncbi:MAG: UDP-N-acetylmuramate dehydrogenase [Bacillota bacterium]
MKAKKSLLEELTAENIAYFQEETMAEYTTFKVGGPAELFLKPDSEEKLITAIKKLHAHHVDYFVLGGGSNIIVSDQGMRGAVIALERLNDIKLEETTVNAQAGVSLEDLCLKTAAAGLAGLEFASGIPGSLGGAVYMNAGAYGGEIKDVITSAKLYQPGRDLKNYDKKSLQLGYRSSVLQKENLIALSATFTLKQDDPQAINQQIEELNERRWAKQPMEYPSAGSAFKRPKNNYAGSLIEKAGLKGKTMGGAKVSEKHAGFIINYADATAHDIVKLMQVIQNKVYQQFKVKLYPEPRFVGQFNELPELDNRST